MSGFFVAGIPVPQGSKKGFSARGSSFVQIVDDNKAKLQPWREAIAKVAAATWEYGKPLEGPVRVEAIFVLPRGKTVRREWPHVKPDSDKLLRALLDGITDAKCVWGDDAQVVQLVAEKVYGAAPGVHVVISPVGESRAPVESAAA